MEETVTTDLPVDYMTSGDVDYGEIIEDNCLRVPHDIVVFAGVCMVISVCGLVGNGIVLQFLCSHMKQNPFTVYILNLAIADFSMLLLFFLLTLAILSLVAVCSDMYHVALYLEFLFVSEFLFHFFDLSSLSLLTAISMERSISVLFPIWYRCHRPKHLSGIVSGVLWVFAVLFVSLMYLSLNLAERYETTIASIAITITVILSSMMFISNLFLFLKLRCNSQRRHPGRLYVAVLLNVIFFFALGVPFSIDVFLNLPVSHELIPETTSFLLALLNCSINPVIYFLVGSCRRRRFQSSIKVAFHQVFEDKALSKETNAPGDTVVETTLEGAAGEERGNIVVENAP